MIRGRIEAWALARIARHYNGMLGARKRAMLCGLRGDVLEVGSGTGANLAFLEAGVRWLGVDPNRFSHARARREATASGVAATVCCARAEHLPFADDCFDAVVATLTLCSVADPAQALREIRRVLKPGGQYVFLEHVAAPQGSAHLRVQQRARPLFRCCLRCNPLLETERLIREAGFLQGGIDRFEVDMPVVRPHIAGVVAP